MQNKELVARGLGRALELGVRGSWALLSSLWGQVDPLFLMRSESKLDLFQRGACGGQGLYSVGTTSAKQSLVERGLGRALELGVGGSWALLSAWQGQVVPLFVAQSVLGLPILSARRLRRADAFF